MSIHVLSRNDIAELWTLRNPVLYRGEVGLETDTRTFKVGDGQTAWVALPYWGTGTGLPPGGNLGDLIVNNSPGSGEWQSPRPQVIIVPEGARELAATDDNGILVFTNAGAIAFSVPAESVLNAGLAEGEAVGPGFITHLHQVAEGQITIAPVAESGVVINAAISLKTRVRYSSLSLLNIGTDDWLVIGDQEIPV